MRRTVEEINEALKDKTIAPKIRQKLAYAKKNYPAKAAEAYEEAVRLDPLHAPSWLGLAESYALRAHYGMAKTLEACAKAKDALATARGINGETAEALYIEGFAAFIERDWRGCDDAYRHSLLLDPDNSRALGTFGIINCVLGRKEEAMALFQRSRDADPLAAYPYVTTGAGLVILAEPDVAISFLEQAIAFESDNSLALWSYSEACVALKKFDEGIASAEKAVTITQRSGFCLGLLGWVLASAGRTDEAEAILAELRQRSADLPSLVHEACLLGTLGYKDAAFELLSRATDEFSPMTCYVGMPCFDCLRGDQRLDLLVEQLKLPN